MNYIPETQFQITSDNRMVYNLRQEGYRKGMPAMTNDIAVSIEARHLPEEVQEEIARVICVALNRELVNGQLGGLEMANDQGQTRSAANTEK